jgi:hypothetical protein
MTVKKNVDNRKIFFLHPQAVVQDELARAFIEEHFETYLLRNHVSAKLILRDFPDSILLMQVDSGQEKQKWIEYANDLKANPVFSGLTLCVLSVSSMEEIRKTFLDRSEALSYGFSYGQYDYEKTYMALREMFEREKASPPRFAVKGTAQEKTKISVVFTRDNNRYEGLLREISITGLTFKFEGIEPLYPSEVPIPSIVISHRTSQFVVSGRIVGNSDDDSNIHLILFDEITVSARRNDIYDLIQTCLQSQIEAQIAEKSKKNRLATKPTRAQLYRK